MHPIMIALIELANRWADLGTGRDPFHVVLPIGIVVFTAVVLMRVAVVCARLPKS